MHPLLLAVTFVLATAAADPATGDSYVVEKDKVYYGTADSFKSPATVDRDKVFEEISAYKQIKKEGLTRKDARYWMLIKKANDVFSRALSKVASDGGYDLIAETGSVKPKGKGKKTPPDVTSDAIKAVKSVERDG